MFELFIPMAFGLSSDRLVTFFQSRQNPFLTYRIVPIYFLSTVYTVIQRCLKLDSLNGILFRGITSIEF